MLQKLAQDLACRRAPLWVPVSRVERNSDVDRGFEQSASIGVGVSVADVSMTMCRLF